MLAMTRLTCWCLHLLIRIKHGTAEADGNVKQLVGHTQKYWTISTTFWPDGSAKDQRIHRVIRLYLLRTMNGCIKFHCNPSNNVNTIHIKPSSEGEKSLRFILWGTWMNGNTSSSCWDISVRSNWLPALQPRGQCSLDDALQRQPILFTKLNWDAKSKMENLFLKLATPWEYTVPSVKCSPMK